MSPDNQKRLTKILEDADIRRGTTPCPECKANMRSADADWLCPACFLRVPKRTTEQPAVATCANPATGCHKTSSCDCPVDTPSIVTDLVKAQTPTQQALLAQREEIWGSAPARPYEKYQEAAAKMTSAMASETLTRLYEKYQFDEVRAAQMAEYARRNGLWPAGLGVKPGCPCPGCNWGHLSFNITDKSLECVYGLSDGCGVHFTKKLRELLKTETPTMIVRAMMFAVEEATGKWPEVMRVSHIMGNAVERELLLATKIDLPHARKYVKDHPQPIDQIRPGERFLCNFDGTWLIQRRDEEERPERRKAPRYDEPRPGIEGVAYTRNHPRHVGMATIGDLCRELNKEGLDLLGDVRLNPAACAAIRNALRSHADNGFFSHQVPLPTEFYIGPWFVALLGGEDKLGRKPGGRGGPWQEEVDRQRAAEAMHREREEQARQGAAIARHGLIGLATPDL